VCVFQISSETTRVVAATVAAFDVPPQALSRNITTCLEVFSSEHHVKKDSTFFFHSTLKTVFLKFKSKD
jgi:hypothetical protein